MKKSLKSLLLCLCLLTGAVLFMSTPREAHAASYSRTDRTVKVGKYYIWTDYSSDTLRISKSRTGNGTVLVKAASGRDIGFNALSNGSTIYYIENKPVGYTSTISYIYRIKVNGSGKKYIGKVRNAFSIGASYGNNLYINCYANNDPMLIHTYRLNLKNGKSARVIKNVCVSLSYDKYLIGQPNRGDYGPSDLYVYNCKSGKTKKITKNCGSFSKVKNKLYYAEFTKMSYTSSTHTFRIRRCNFSGSGKKTVVAKIKAMGIGKITSTYVYYQTYINDTSRYYRYKISTKKPQRIKRSQYLSF